MHQFKVLFGIVSLVLIASCGSSNSPEIPDTPDPIVEKQAIPIINFDNKIEQLATFARVATSIEFFYPGDGAYNTDWDKFIAVGMYEVANAGDDVEFADTMRKLFEDVAPDVEFNADNYQAPIYDTNQQVIVWHQNGYYDRLSSDYSIYQDSVREVVAFQELLDDDTYTDATSYHIEYDNLTMDMPLVLISDSNSSIPSGNEYLDSEEWIVPALLDNPYVCLASMAKIWAGVQNYWVYFETINIDWESELPLIMESCANEDRNVGMGVFQKAITKLQDNHVGVAAYYGYFTEPKTVPISFASVEQKTIVTAINESSPSQVAIGDELLLIDGLDVNLVIAENSLYTRKSNIQRIDFTTIFYMIRRQEGEEVELTFKNIDDETYTVNSFATGSVGEVGLSSIEAIRAEATEQLKVLDDNILYVDLSITLEEDVETTLEKMKLASAIVLDLRNYPNGWFGWWNTIAHFSEQRISAPPLFKHWRIAPDRFNTVKKSVEQYIEPATPLIDVPVIALSSRYSQSQNEHVLAYIQNAGIPILGVPTSGINGNITYLYTFGGVENQGMSFAFTGLEVTQNDGTPHIGVGILPDIFVERTIESIRTSEDNQLQAAIEYLKEQMLPE